MWRGHNSVIATGGRGGDLVMWDNRCLLHRAINYDMATYRRVLRRTTVAGVGPISGPFSGTS